MDGARSDSPTETSNKSTPPTHPPKKKSNLRLLIWLTLLAAAIVGQPQIRKMIAAIKAKKADWTADKSELEYRSKTESILGTLHQKLDAPKPGDWLDSQFEPGQTFAQYIQCEPVVPTKNRHTIFVQPLGDLTKKQREIITVSAEFIGLYFDCPIRILPDLPASVVAKTAQRINGNTRQKQFHSMYILDEVLAPRLPDEALAYIAFTATDLYPRDDWNYVFGQASIKKRVGVWSIARYGDPEASDAAYRQALLRTLKVATHETGHMLSMYHCTQYVCNMCGSNSLEETDRHPLWLCPKCVAKLHWATKANPLERFESLGAFCRKHGLRDSATYFAKAAKLWRSHSASD